MGFSQTIFQSTHFWQALSLILGVLFLREKYAPGLLGSLDPSTWSGHRGTVSHQDIAGPPGQIVFNKTSALDATQVFNKTPAIDVVGAQPLDHPFQGGEKEEEVARRLAGGSTNAGCDAKSGGHPHVSLFYMLTAILLGTIVLTLMMLPAFHGLQQTVVLFMLGLIHSFIFHFAAVHDEAFGHSYDMWMNIDPHLLLYSMLPALLTGDAITIDTSIARKVSQQCIYLAGPGVLLGAFGIAAFLHLYFGWGFLLCVVTGSILSATDPVAVVGLLKELGASPTLTVQIQGESLLNDGTAIVLYLLAYDTLSGRAYDAGEVIIFLVKMALSALLLGSVIGYIFLQWIRLACKRLEHHAGLIQTTLTICCAYSSFCIAEGLLGISGVLCTVSAALVLADKMWPSIVEKEGLHQVWHMLEYLGNTLIFFLAGGLTAKAVIKRASFRDILDLLILYVVCTIVRGVILFASRPILGYLSETRTPVSWQDATIMTWGGLRGAVGLALAVQVNIGRVEGKISEDEASQVLFFVAGMACLTLAVNATTSPILVRALGVTRTPQAKQRMLLSICDQMRRIDARKENPKVVHQAIAELMVEALAHVDKMTKKVKRSSSKLPHSMQALATKTKEMSVKSLRKLKPVIPSVYVNDLVEYRGKYHTIPRGKMRLLQVPKLPGMAYDDSIIQHAQKDECEYIMIHTMNEAHLLLVRSHYWHLIDNGEFVDGSSDSELLLHSVRLGIDTAEKGQLDLSYLKQQLHLVHEKAPDPKSGSSSSTRTSEHSEGDVHPREDSAEQPWSKSDASTLGGLRSTSIGKVLLVDQDSEKSFLRRMTESVAFNVFMGSMIVLNVMYIVYDQINEDDSRKLSEDLSWALELFFVTIFTGEFLLKFIAFRCSYFAEAWNIFDFALVVIGLVGLVILGIMQGLDEGSADDMSQEARIFRINKVFRVLRIVRIFRLLNFARLLYAKIMKKEFCLQLAEQLQSITVLKAFIKAHMHAQEKMLTYFGHDGKPSTTEVAVCLVQSQAQVYRALYMAGKELEFVDPAIIKNVNIQRKVFETAHELSDFVLQALNDGVITARMAETVLHPVRDHMRVIDRMLSEVQSGMRGRKEDESPGPDGQRRSPKNSLTDVGFYDSEDNDDDDSGVESGEVAQTAL